MTGISSRTEITRDYRSSLSDLTMNSKPLITMLTMLAEENKVFASDIVNILSSYIKEATIKLPVLYLIDSIIKNVGGDYKRLLNKSLVNIFETAFKSMDESNRRKMYELRQTWNEVFAPSRLYLLDATIKEIDPAWPTIIQSRHSHSSASNIHVNPKYKGSTTKTSLPASYSPKRVTKENFPKVHNSEVKQNKPRTHHSKSTKAASTSISKMNANPLLQTTMENKKRIMKETIPKSSLPVRDPKISQKHDSSVQNSRIISNSRSSNRDPRLTKMFGKTDPPVALKVTSKKSVILENSSKVAAFTSKIANTPPAGRKNNQISQKQQITETIKPSCSKQNEIQPKEMGKVKLNDIDKKSKSSKILNKKVTIKHTIDQYMRSRGDDRKSKKEESTKEVVKHKIPNSISSINDVLPISTKLVLSSKEKITLETLKESILVIPQLPKENCQSTKKKSVPYHNPEHKFVGKIPKISQVEEHLNNEVKTLIFDKVSPSLNVEIANSTEEDMQPRDTVLPNKISTEPSTSSETNKKSNPVLNLFGTEDIDLRMLPHAKPYQNTAEISTAYAVSKPDIMNEKNASHVAYNLDTAEPNIRSVQDTPKARRLSVQKPNSASWEKFRDKNPQYKEYHEQASISDKPHECYIDYDKLKERRLLNAAVRTNGTKGHNQHDGANVSYSKPFESGSVWRVGSSQNQYEEFYNTEELPGLRQEVLQTVYRNSVSHQIKIDKFPREVRSYGDKAIVLLNWDDPRLISFRSTSCNVYFEEENINLTLMTGEGYKEFSVGGCRHQIKMGVPTQELFIDGKGYQCFFGKKPIEIYLNGKTHTVGLTGRPPSVDICPEKNISYLAGKIEMIVDAKKVIYLYLDAMPQKFHIDGRAFILKFIDSLRAVTINGIKFPVKFDDVPISITVRNYRRFLRFSALPRGIVPGNVVIQGMDEFGSQLIPYYSTNLVPFLHEEGRPVESNINNSSLSRPMNIVTSSSLPESNAMTDHRYLEDSFTFHTKQNECNPLSTVSPGFYQSENAIPISFRKEDAPLDMSSILNSLIKFGVIKDTSFGNEEQQTNDKIIEDDNLPTTADLWKPKVLKTRNNHLVGKLVEGTQCSHCGVRFTENRGTPYAAHLDWHYRRNKKEVESTKKPNDRKFFLTRKEWEIYEEIEDIEDRAPNLFEIENDNDGHEIAEDVPSVMVSNNRSLGVCSVCHDTFDQYFDDDTEDWRYRYAVSVEEVNYHPGCHTDLLKQIEKEDDEKEQQEAEEKRQEVERNEQDIHDKCKDIEEKQEQNRLTIEKDKTETFISTSISMEDQTVLEKEGGNSPTQNNKRPRIIEENETYKKQKLEQKESEIGKKKEDNSEKLFSLTKKIDQEKRKLEEREENKSKRRKISGEEVQFKETCNTDNEQSTSDVIIFKKGDNLELNPKQTDMEGANNFSIINTDMNICQTEQSPNFDSPMNEQYMQVENEFRYSPNAGNNLNLLNNNETQNDVDINLNNLSEIIPDPMINECSNEEVPKKLTSRADNMQISNAADVHISPIIQADTVITPSIEMPSSYTGITIKSEPVEATPVPIPLLLADLPIKMEIDEEPPEVNEEDDEVSILQMEDIEEPQNVSQVITNILQSSIDGNTEQSIPEPMPTSSSMPIIRINVAKRHTDKIIAEESDDLPEKSPPAKEPIEEFIAPPFSFDASKKPLFVGAELVQQPIDSRGMEVSSMCSIM